MNPDRIVRRGSWAAFALGGLYLAAMLVAPIVGVAMAALFFALGWGIRRKEIWAAAAASIVLIAPLFQLLASRQTGLVWGATVGMQLAMACLPVWAAVTLWRHREIARFNRAWLVLAAVLVLGAIALRSYNMPTASMANTIDRGDYILTESLSWKLGRTPRDGDVVVLHYPIDPKQTFVKRIVGVPGDRIRIVNKQLFRNGAPVSEAYAIHATEYIDFYRDNFPSVPNVQLPPPALDMLHNHVSNGEVVVPPGQYFVLGDNRDDSFDSRYWGFVTRAEIMASPLVIYASYNLPAERPAATGTILNTRWNRLLKFL
jgi:signal peptidase I